MIGVLLALRRRVRFALWVARLRLRMRRHEARLAVDAPHGAGWEAPPNVRIVGLGGDGGRGGTTTLRIGAGVSLGSGLRIELWAGGENRLELGDGVDIFPGVNLDLRDGTIALGDHVTVRTGAVLRATDGTLTLAERAGVSWQATVACSERIEIGEQTGIGERTTIIDSDHRIDGSSTPWPEQPLATTPIAIGANVLISSNVMILRGATVGDNAVIAANAVVRGGRDYPAGWLIGGSPARALRAMDAVVDQPCRS